MQGKLTPDHTAHVEVKLIESEDLFDAIVDTGFTDCVFLSGDKVVASNLPFIATVPMALADRTIVNVDVYEANIIWFGKSQRVTVTAGPYACDSLIGMKLLEGCRMDLDVVNGEVRIEQL